MLSVTRKLALLFVAVVSCQPGVVLAATATSNLSVTATVANSCVVTTSDLDFGVLTQGSATNEATNGVLSLTCTGSQSGVTVTLDGGQNEQAGQRRMTDGSGNFVPYSIYSDAGRVSAVVSGGTIFSGNLTAASTQNVNVYGQVPSGNYINGSFSDTILVTLTY